MNYYQLLEISSKLDSKEAAQRNVPPSSKPVKVAGHGEKAIGRSSLPKGSAAKNEVQR